VPCLFYKLKRSFKIVNFSPLFTWVLLFDAIIISFSLFLSFSLFNPFNSFQITTHKMGAQVVDYRVSTLVVLCKDCGHDVGLYPARHKCVQVERPAMPALPMKYQQQQQPKALELNPRTISSSSTVSTSSSSPSPSFSSVEQSSTNSSKWSSRLTGNKANVQAEEEEGEDSVYFNNFASNLPEEKSTQKPSGKKLWGKVKENEKWKQLSEKSKAEEQ
jgi:hypothetical protein